MPAPPRYADMMIRRAAIFLLIFFFSCAPRLLRRRQLLPLRVTRHAALMLLRALFYIYGADNAAILRLSRF